MKRVMINAYQVGLVFKDGVYQRMLTEGKYWLWMNETVKLYDRTMPFVPPIDLNILLKDDVLSNELHCVAVADNEIVLRYENGLLKEVLTAGRYAYWKGIIEYEFIKADISKLEITEPVSKAVLQNKLLFPFIRTYTVETYEKALLFVDGQYVQALAPGVYNWWKNNIIVIVGKVDTRVQQLEIAGQEILTKDKAALRINAQAQYKVTDAEKALLQNKEYDRQLYIAFQLSLRAYVAGFSFDELLEKKDAVAEAVLEQVRPKVALLGVEVTDFGIRDIILPGDVKDIMHKVLIAEKNAQANSIMRREETASTRSLLNTARLMEENPVLWKMKEMEHVEKIAERIGEITINGNGVLLEQLKQLFVPAK